MTDITKQLIKECKRQEEACLYTSTTLFIWLKFAKWIDRILIALPIICSGIATAAVLNDNQIITGVAALLAGIIPAVYKALDFNVNVEEIASLAGEFKNLQDRFRQAAQIESLKQENCFEAHVQMLIQRLEIAREKSIVPPEWCFIKAQAKIKEGHYDFGIDDQSRTCGKAMSI